MRSKDRLHELRQLAETRNGTIYNQTVEVFCHDEKKNAANVDIQLMFEEIEKIRLWIQDIERNTILLHKLYADETFHTNKSLQDQLDSVITQTNGIGLKVCGALRQFELRATLPKTNDVIARIARLQYASTRQMYSDALADHQVMLQTIRDHQYNLIQEQIRLTNLSISEDECQELLDTRNLQLFVDNVQAETEEARLALRDVEERHHELLKIEESIKEVRDLFVQMSHLVAQQQDLVDTVEYYATQASELVEYGGQELLKGKVNQRKARNKKVGLIVCLVTGFLIVIFVLIAT